MLSNIDCELICKNLDIDLNFCDYYQNLPNRLENGSYILNMDNDIQAPPYGTHWTALYVKNDSCVYCDSFGDLNKIPQSVMNILNTKKNVYMNHKQLQHVDDTHCGFYAISFLKHCEMNKKSNLKHCLNSYIFSFNDDTKNNLSILQEKFKKFIM